MPNGEKRKNIQPNGMEDTPVKQINEMQASKLSYIGFKRMVLRMLKELNDNYKELSGKYNSMKEEFETVNKKQEEMQNTIIEKKIILEGIISSLGETEV